MLNSQFPAFVDCGAHNKQVFSTDMVKHHCAVYARPYSTEIQSAENSWNYIDHFL